MKGGSLIWPNKTYKVEKCLEQFLEFLKGCKEPPTFPHVMFRAGTVVRLDNTENTKLFEDFDSVYMNEYPMHRLEKDGDFENFLKDNRINFQEALKLCKTSTHREWIQKAYSVLIGDGYPLPGGEGADTQCIPIEKEGKAAMTIFTHRDLHILTVTSLDEIENYSYSEIMTAHDYLGRSHRRLDFMFPKPFAIIDGLKIHILKP